MLAIPEISDVDVAFPARALEWCPPMKDIPNEHKNFNGDSKQRKLCADLLFSDVNYDTLKFLPKEGIDPEKAWKAIRATAGSFTIHHEHKEACITYFLSEWFIDFSYARKDGSEVKWDISFDEELKKDG